MGYEQVAKRIANIRFDLLTESGKSPAAVAQEQSAGEFARTFVWIFYSTILSVVVPAHI